MNRNCIGVARLALALMSLCALTSAQADTDINVNTVINNGTFTTIRVSPNGSATPPITLDFGGTAYANVLELYNNGVANVSGGSIDAIAVLNQGLLNLSGGTINYGLNLFDEGRAFVSGGAINGDVDLKGVSYLSLNGGTINGTINARETSSAAIFTGTVNGDVIVTDYANATLHNGGVVGGKISATDSGDLFLYGGQAQEGLFTLSHSFAYFYALPNTFSATPIDTWTDGIVYGIDFKDAGGKAQSFFLFDDDTVDPNRNFLSVDVAAVPEPGVVAFGVIAAGSVVGMIVRKRKV